MANLKIGAHKSIAGGLDKALERVVGIGGNCLQIFSASPRSWKLPDLSDEEIKEFKEKVRELDVSPVYFHASYLINLGDDGRVGKLSKRALKAEFELAEKLGVSGSVVHVGSFKDRSEKPAQEHEKYDILIENMKEVLDDMPEDVHLLVENAGMKKIGKYIEEIEHIIKDLDDERVTVCLDTCHLHAAGYDITSKKKLDKFLKDFDNKIGLEKLELWHLNDSRDELGSFRDRHENIGEGSIGSDTFNNILNHPDMKGLPLIIETPGFDDKGPDEKNIKILKDLYN